MTKLKLLFRSFLSISLALPIIFTTSNLFGNELVIDEVIVTAEKRAESLQDVSKAVTALSSEEIERKNLVDFVGLSAIAPGVTVAKNEGYKTIISIRGVGDETNQNAIAAPSVALHMDGIFIASKFSLRTDFIDLERIEVLRGPQGTLFALHPRRQLLLVLVGIVDVIEAERIEKALAVRDHELLQTRCLHGVRLGIDHRRVGFEHEHRRHSGAVGDRGEHAVSRSQLGAVHMVRDVQERRQTLALLEGKRGLAPS